MPKESMNLLPDRERKEAEAALKRVSQSGKSDEIKLVMPQEKKDEPKKSWLARWKEKRAKPAPAAAPVAAPKPLPAPMKQTPVAAKAETSKPEFKKAAAKPAKSKEAPALAMHMPEKEEPKLKPIPPLMEKKAPVPPTPKKEVKVAAKEKEEKAKLHVPDATDGFLGPKVNLVPEHVVSEAQGIPWGIYAGTVVVVLGLWVAVSGYAISRANKAETKVQELNAKLTQTNVLVKEYEADKNVHVALQKQFSHVQALLDGHVYWTPFLQKLEETTIPDVYYLGITANRNGDVTLRSIAKTYTAAARQIRAFERSSTFVKSLQVNQVRQELQKGATLPVPVIAFDVQLKLIPGIFSLPAPEGGQSSQQQPSTVLPGQVGQVLQQGNQGAQQQGQQQQPGAGQPAQQQGQSSPQSSGQQAAQPPVSQ